MAYNYTIINLSGRKKFYELLVKIFIAKKKLNKFYFIGKLNTF